ncbi:DUF2325 domain-containing protein [Cytobacillus sp. FJAT-54145]|uniref:DUF2325 domain-containing protein n=1 Tax=Cytobacillus spartinae TaxID=3299023 RepID=A0ABW6KAN6_9BACI
MLNILTELEHLPNLVTSILSIHPLSESPIPAPAADIQPPLVKKEKERPSDAYVFERKLQGGFLPEGNIFVPESIIRSLGIEHGDVVRATVKNPHSNPPQCYFEVVEKAKTKADAPSRRQISHAVVTKVAGEMFAEPVDREALTEEERYRTFRISATDSMKFFLEEGDVIDIAYYDNNSDAGVKVIWKHSTDGPTHKTPLPSSHYKSKEDQEPQEHTVTVNYNGSNVLVVGGDCRKARYQEAIERCNGEFNLLEGTADQSRLESAIKRADVVAIMIEYTSHQSSWDTVKFCKQYGVPFVIRNTMGVNMLLVETASALQKPDLYMEASEDLLQTS